MSGMRLAVVGAGGRMGRALVRAVHETDGTELAGASAREGSRWLGADAGLLAGIGETGIALRAGAAALEGADGVLDFTAPGTSAELAARAAEAGFVHVIGTTGFSPEQDAAIARAGERAAIVKSGNMSLGVNLLAALVARAARALGDWDVEIAEMHHRHKVDAPSGTALLLGRAAAEGRGVDLDARAVTAREGHTGPRPEGAIGFAALRGGSVVGEHTVVRAGQGERVELVHRAEDRGIFALGAVKAALWARGRAPGLYSMADVLGL